MRRLLLRVRVRHFEAHEEFCFGADGHAEGLLWGGTSGIAGGGNRHPTSCQKRLTPPGTVGDTWAALAAMAVAAATTITRVRSRPARKGDAVRPQAHPGNEWLCIFGVSPCKQTLVDCLVQTFRLPAELGLFTHFPDGAAHTARMAHHQPLRQPVSRHRSPLSHQPRYQGLFVGIESATIQ